MSGPGSSQAANQSLNLMQRIEAIESVEQKIDQLLAHLQNVVVELAKEKQISKTKMDDSCLGYKRTLQSIEADLGSQLQYLANVCVGSAHQGSTFASQRIAEIAEESEELLHAELDRIRIKHLPENPEASMKQQACDDEGSN